MSNTYITVLMNLSLPVVGAELGPLWASDLNTAFELVDAHDHTDGKGSKIPTGAILINDDLDLLEFGILNVKHLDFYNNAAALSAATYPGAVYVAGGELYYNDESGNQVKLTSAGTINVSSVGGIGGDYSTDPDVSADYSTAGTVFSFLSSPTIYSKMSLGDLKIFERVAGGHSAGLKAPTGLGADYDLSLFTALPASTLPVQLSAAGQLITGKITTAQITLANITAALMAADSIATANIIDAAVTNNKLASNAVTAGKIANGQVTYAKLVAKNVEVSSAFTGDKAPGDISGALVVVATSGKPVLVKLQSGTLSGAIGAVLNFYRDSTLIESYPLTYATTYFCDQFCFIDVVGSGGYIYKVNVSVNHVNIISNTTLMAVEL